MKTRCLIGFAVLLAMVACHHSVQDNEPAETLSHELSAIDSLMWRQPDSAFVRLQQFAASPQAGSLDRFNGHYCQLLISELLYKNDYAQSNRPALLQAVAYFDSLTLALNDTPTLNSLIAGEAPLSLNRVFLDARAHYINGVGYYERDSVVEACKEYLKALEVMEERFGEKELVGHKAQFMAYTYTRLTDLFSDLYLHEQTIYYAKLSLPYYQKQNVFSWYFASMFNEIGSQYDMMKQLDSAELYYKKALDASKDTTALLYRDITAHLIFLEYKKEHCLAGSSIIRLNQLIQNAESDIERQVRYQYIGEIFYHEQRYDSAWVYLNKVYQTTSVENLKKQAAEWLVEIGKTKGMEVHDYTDFLVPFANLEENTSEIKSQLTELYKAFGQAQQERHHSKKYNKNEKDFVTLNDYPLSYCSWTGIGMGNHSFPHL